ncbi:SusC/RagA family TonB-linked outer membrane protein [Chryseobacterium sp. Ch-15]|uniref:SusC/RagA family TonB-linked outer membrane protein n=1 Tax=Chryseobacterium muglaense TaxID=2893752 RepID=A0A9Q3UVQ7_9FLAO|nr:SusC/RagA family TonB-linked outer membrane protein [Chryseobacterium muglaense]MBD3903804.1 SusC/RagA family TonB-linked outer membrane protein [Chryseobacterium muglaense]MCC9034878.1 SusC/RagA family TonB-linked outer membrane protein [Chryseobacterium muglaense]MCM2553143.1 SusC/RagA family TonB-linked outer membrane protein [Chryseobacterium muglaense]
MNVKLRVLSAGALFFLGQVAYAQTTKSDTTTKETQIEEVVMVGFGQKRAVQEITGSTSTMKAKAIEDIPVASVDKMLQGRVTGVQTGASSGQPGGFAAVRVRGVASINGGVNPIYIVDGVRIASGDLTGNSTTSNILASLNPDDIESLTVLKDAVSTAVYGADAGAGVIVITTKSGKKGKPRFNVSFNHGVSDRAVEGYRGLSADQYKRLVAVSALNRYSSLGTIENAMTQLEGGALGAGVASIYTQGGDTDWRKELSHSGAYVQNADVSVSGGNEQVSYYSSVNYFDQNSIVKNSYFNRLTFTNKLDVKATDKFRFGTNLQFSYSKISTLSNGGGFSNPILGEYFLRPTDPVFNADGSYYWGGNGRMSNGLFNNAALLSLNSQTGKTARIFGNLYAEYDILKNFKYRFVFAPEFINLEEDEYRSPVHGDGTNYNGLAVSGSRRYFNFNVQNILSYNFRLADKHNFDFSAIQEAYKSDFRNITATGSAVGALSLTTLTNFVKMQSMAGGRSENSRYGYALTGHYDFDKLVLLDASYRRDVLSNFTPGQKAGDFWSAGVGFDVARLDFIKNIDAISSLKFRASYGKVGNQISALPYALFQYSTNYNDLAAASYSGFYNPNLKWETIKPFNVGFDFGFFKNRLTVSADYYNKKTEDLVYNIPLSAAQGLPSYVDNIGDLVNKGFEFSVNADIFKGSRDQFNLTIGANLSTLDNKITSLYGGDVNTGLQTIRVGEGVRTWYLRKWAGVDATNGDPLWYKNGVDGETTNNYNNAKQAVQGSFLSKVFGGANINVAYKGIGLDAQFTYGFGGKVYDDWSSYLFSDGQYTANYPGYADQMDYWSIENPNAANPKPIYGGNKRSNQASTRFLYDSDYIRLGNAKLSYTFDRPSLNGSGLNSVQIYVMGTNLWTHTFDDRLKLDPEINLEGTSNLNLPIMRTYSIGVNIGF